MRKIRVAGALVLSASMAMLATGAFAESMGTAADAVENAATAEGGGPDLLLAENAHIERRADGVTISLKLITPEAGAYTYPESITTERRAQPELFTGWAFIFNYPELCATPNVCGPTDFNDQVKAGVYNFAGTVNQLSQSSGGEIVLNAASDGYVTLVGDIALGQAQRPNTPPDAITYPLENPDGAQIHAAIAPHGQLDPSTLPDELYNPTGNPACGCWWIAMFDPPQAVASR